MKAIITTIVLCGISIIAWNATAHKALRQYHRDLNTNHTRLNYEPIKCISIYGLETNLKDTICSWKHPAEYYIDEVKKLGFNTIRVPISFQYLFENSLEKLDTILSKAEQSGMMIIIDFHRVGNSRQEENWDVGIVEYKTYRQDILNQIVKVVTRYINNKSLIGINSWNEYTGLNVSYKIEWDTTVFNMIENIYPDRLLYFTTGILWGGIVTGYSLEHLPYNNRIVYSTHKYHFSGTGDRQDWDASFGNSYPPDKLIVGEYGFRDPEDMEFGERFTSYLVEKHITNHCFWTIAHSGDTGGLWNDDCEHINMNKVKILQKLL